jgi:mRNA interferase HigB
MRIFSRKTLSDYWQRNAVVKPALSAWFAEAEKANWKSPTDIKKDYPSASILADNRVVFNIKGNSYRLIVKINYDYGQVFIRFIGTHAEYDSINALTI